MAKGSFLTLPDAKALTFQEGARETCFQIAGLMGSLSAYRTRLLVTLN